jgi:hypothetical protein
VNIFTRLCAPTALHHNAVADAWCVLLVLSLGHRRRRRLPSHQPPMAAAPARLSLPVPPRARAAWLRRRRSIDARDGWMGWGKSPRCIVVVSPSCRCTRVLACLQVLLNELRPEAPEVLGPQLQDLLQRMWRTDPTERPDIAAVLDALDAAAVAGPDACFSDHAAPERC